MITEIFINGDSYSAEGTDVVPYSTFLEQRSKIPVINFARSGSSNDRIFRTTLEYCLNLNSTQRPLILAGFSFVTREESWVDDIVKYASRIKDYPGSKFVSTDWIENRHLDNVTRHLIIDQNINKQMIYFYTKLYMFTQTLKSLGFPYFLFSAANNKDFKKLDWSSLTNLNIYQQVQADPSIFDLHNFNIPVWATENGIQTTRTGHLYTNGHEIFSEFLYSKIVQNYLTINE